MCQTLFHIPRELGGVPLFGFGWLLAVWAVGGVVWMAWLIRRQGFNADTWEQFFLLSVLGVVIGVVLPVLSENQGLPIRGYGTMLLSGGVAGVALACHRARRMGVDPQMILSLAFWIFISGMVGARLFYIIEYWEDFQKESLGATVGAMVNVPQGGLVVYGSAIGAGIALAVFARRHRLPGLALADLVAPSLLVGLALGRVGCFLNGCCYGGPCPLPWAVTFPWQSPPHIGQAQQGQIYLHGLEVVGEPKSDAIVKAVEPNSPAARAGIKPGDRIVRIQGREIDTAVNEEQDVPQRLTVEGAQRALLKISGAQERVSIYIADRPAARTWTIAQAAPRSLPVHPAQIYSAIDALVLCLFLLAYYPYRRRDGEVFGLLITIHPITRFLLEIIRTDESAVFGTGLSISQNISLVMLVGAAGFWLYLARRPIGSIWPEPAAATGG